MHHNRLVTALAILIACPLLAAEPGDKTSTAGGSFKLPPYVIEAPDVLAIDLPRPIPKAYRVAKLDVVKIHLANPLPGNPVDGDFGVLDDGTIDLGPRYGTVHVAGMTIDETRDAIDKQLRKLIGKPRGSVELLRASRAQPVTGQYLVGPDGTINLRDYGVVNVAGSTVAEARVLIKDQLKRHLDSAELSVEVVAYNSKVYYVITQGDKLGDNVRRLPVTGNETVLDAVSQIGGLTEVSSKKMWIARPAPNDFGGQKILSIDWDGIAQGSSTETNYQLLPSDRLYIADDESKSKTDSKPKATTGSERISGMMGSSATLPMEKAPSGYRRSRNGL